MALTRPQFKRPKFERAAWREWLIVIIPALLLIVAAFAITSRFIKPAPPDTFVFSAGAEGGAYYRYALRYREILARDGIKMQVHASAGAPQNLSRMRGTAPEASAGFVQGGTALPEDSNTMLSLGRMFYELVWVFHRLPNHPDRFTQLRGKRIAVGPAGSGTHQLAMQLLAQSGVTAANSTLLEISAKSALEKLAAAELDVVFVVAGPESDNLQAPLRSKQIQLMSLSHAEAYAMQFSHLARITLRQGVVDIKENIPSRDVQMIGAGAMVAVRDDLHPALQFALAQAAAEVHKRPSIIHAESHFPQSQSSELPMSPVAERFHKTGPPFFQRYLPFWIAVWMDRLLVLLIPVVTILIPLFKIVPFLYTWRVRKRLWHWYRELKKLEGAIA
ncbi:MAG TPA: TAXI family TRAP transporter solute-binding subunit, partial [Burkholderiales bacterium]|nr:TAXI family TRAP transporter solute-binding subunit [Burkholderiales bacterium]